MEQETKERNPREHHKLLCFLLAIIVILIVISGSCIYYFCLRSAQLKEELEMLKEKEQSDLNRGVIAETNQISLDETNMTSDIQNSSENMTIYHEVEIKEPGI